jgi:hypothetical protein
MKVATMYRLAALLMLAATTAAAQDTASTTPREQRTRGWLVGGAVGVPGSERGYNPKLFTLAVQVTDLRPLRPGIDLAVGVSPRAFAEGLNAIGARAGFVLPVPVARRVILMPGGGASAIIVPGAGAEAGYNLGLSTALRGRDNGAVRIGASMHWLEDIQGVWLLELGYAWLF